MSVALPSREADLRRAANAVRAHLKAACHGLGAGDKKTFLLPDWNVEVVMRERTVYKVPAEVSKQYADTASYPHVVDISRSGETEGPADELSD